ncbi:hypothetical protein MTO96_026684 [Rhipicephalus appendiculatus]
MFKANNTNTTVAGATSPTPVPFQFGSNTQWLRRPRRRQQRVSAHSLPAPASRSEPVLRLPVAPPRRRKPGFLSVQVVPLLPRLEVVRSSNSAHRDSNRSRQPLRHRFRRRRQLPHCFREHHSSLGRLFRSRTLHQQYSNHSALGWQAPHLLRQISTPFAFGASSSGPAAASPFTFGVAATTTAPGTAPFSFGAGTTSTPAFSQSSATSPLFPSAAPVGQPSSAVAQPGGFQFGAAQVQNAFGAATNGLSNGISSNAAAQPSVAAPGLFKFGAANNSSVPAFNFGASQCGTNATPKPAFNFGAPAATSNLFSIGTTSSHSERPLARPRSKRITKK